MSNTGQANDNACDYARRVLALAHPAVLHSLRHRAGRLVSIQGEADGGAFKTKLLLVGNNGIVQE